MQINSNFPVRSNIGQLPSSKSLVPVDNESSQTTQFSLPVSPLINFEQAADAQQSRFTKMEGLDRMTQEAIDSYQVTQSLAADNPRHYLIGIDVFA